MKWIVALIVSSSVIEHLQANELRFGVGNSVNLSHLHYDYESINGVYMNHGVNLSMSYVTNSGFGVNGFYSRAFTNTVSYDSKFQRDMATITLNAPLLQFVGTPYKDYLLAPQTVVSEFNRPYTYGADVFYQLPLTQQWGLRFGVGAVATYQTAKDTSYPIYLIDSNFLFGGVGNLPTATVDTSTLEVKVSKGAYKEVIEGGRTRYGVSFSLGNNFALNDWLSVGVQYRFSVMSRQTLYSQEVALTKALAGLKLGGYADDSKTIEQVKAMFSRNTVSFKCLSDITIQLEFRPF